MSLLPASNLSSVALNSRNAESDDVTLQVSFSVFFVKTFPRGSSKVPTSRLTRVLFTLGTQEVMTLQVLTRLLQLFKMCSRNDDAKRFVAVTTVH